MPRPVIALTTDFGQTDSYVGAMKGVILRICPEAVLVDISHEIRPQAVQQAAYLLSTAAPYFPLGTIHLVIVDPGVGTERRPIVVQTDRAIYVAPDNGVLSLALGQEPALQAIHLTEPRYRLSTVSDTFHGRDIFAPAAAHLASGTKPGEMGKPVRPSELVTVPTLNPQLQLDGRWQAEILHVDHFGNLVTNFRIPNHGSPTAVTLAGHRIETLSRTFADGVPGELIAYVGSSGYLEIAVRQGNAARQLDMDIGAPVQVEGIR